MLTRTRPRIEAALEEIYAEPNFARSAVIRTISTGATTASRAAFYSP